MTRQPELARAPERPLWLVMGLLLSASILASCSGAGPSEQEDPPLESNQPGGPSLLVPPADQLEAADSEATDWPGLPSGTAALRLPTETRVDAQGAIEVAITPLVDQSRQSGRLVFEVVLDTHSVDLSMDLSQLATLETDNGLSIPASTWSGGSGHHVTGLLAFELPQGEAITHLQQAQRWTLSLRGVDAPLRVFEWQL